MLCIDPFPSEIIVCSDVHSLQDQVGDAIDREREYQGPCLYDTGKRGVDLRILQTKNSFS